MATGSVVLALIAGILSVLSPCVLPILPVVLGAAASEHKSGPVALAAGLTISFVVVGLSIATIGYSIGLDGDVLRYVAAALIVAIGAVLILPPLQARLAQASGPIAGWTDRRIDQVRAGGLVSQFGIGALLGWSGVLASDRRSEPPRCSLPKAVIFPRSELLCLRSGLAPQFRCLPSGFSLATRCCDGGNIFWLQVRV